MGGAGRAVANILDAATDLTHLNLRLQPDVCDELLRGVSLCCFFLQSDTCTPVHVTNIQSKAAGPSTAAADHVAHDHYSIQVGPVHWPSAVQVLFVMSNTVASR